MICPRCKDGRMTEQKDKDGAYWTCVTCAHHTYPGGAALPMSKGENHARLHGTRAHRTD